MSGIISDFSVDRAIFGLRNLASTQTERVAPWEFRDGSTPHAGTSASSCVFSGFEGTNANPTFATGYGFWKILVIRISPTGINTSICLQKCV